jgi:hypothetical protein
MPTAGTPIPPGCWPPNCITASKPNQIRTKVYITKAHKSLVQEGKKTGMP